MSRYLEKQHNGISGMKNAIGLNDVENEGEWVWSSSSDSDYRNWDNLGQPSGNGIMQISFNDRQEAISRVTG